MTLRIVRPVLALLIALCLASPVSAIVIRHDKEDAKYKALAEKYPAAVAIVPDGTGVLIAPEWVLTAAHVARGVANRAPRIEIAGREVAVAQVLVHPKWKRLKHDVALLRLAEPIANVRPVRLYAKDDEAGQVVVFVGRGDFGTGLTGPQEMDKARRAATNRVDRVDDDWIYFDFDRGDEATELEGVSGPGDSGGPALILDEGELYTLGVSVFADGDQGPGRYGVIEGYTRVSTHRDWILGAMSGKAEAVEIEIGKSKRSNKMSPGTFSKAIGVMPGEATLPGTPAGQLVTDYLTAFNSGDADTMLAFATKSYSKEFFATRDEAGHRARYGRLFGEHFGRLSLMHIAEKSDTSITALLESERGKTAEFRFDFAEGSPPRISGIRAAIVDASFD